MWQGIKFWCAGIVLVVFNVVLATLAEVVKDPLYNTSQERVSSSVRKKYVFFLSGS